MYAVAGPVWYVLVACVVAAWVFAVIVYGIMNYWSDRAMARLMGEFKRRFPHRCFLCSYYRNVMMEHPPEHDCDDWRADHGDDQDR